MITVDWQSINKTMPRITADEVVQGYVVCSSPCGGGELLGRLLSVTKQFGAPHYFFHDNAYTNQLRTSLKVVNTKGDINYVRYLQSLQECKTSENGIFGTLLYTRQLLDHNRLLDRLPNAKLIVVKRLDSVMQTVDAVEMSEIFSGKEPDEVDYLYGKLIECFTILMQEKLFLQQIYQSEPNQMVVIYEDLCSNPFKVLRSVAKFLDVELHLPNSKRKLQKYNDLLPKTSEHKEMIYNRFKKILQQKKIIQ